MQGKNALTAFQKTAALMPGDAEAHFNLGVVQKSFGQLAEAVESYRRALKLNPAYAEAHGNLGNALKDLGQLDQAVASYRSALKIKPGSADAHNNLGTALKDLGQLDQAVASYRRAIALKPDYADAYYNLGNVLKDLGQLDDAVASYRRALDIKPDFVDAHSNLGAVLKELGQLDEAAACFRRAVEIKPDSAEACYVLGNITKQIGQPEAAVECYRRAVELNPENADAYRNLGITLQELGQLDGAVTSYRRLLILKPDFAEAHYNLGTALKDLGQFDSAVVSYRRALEINPDYAETLNNLGAALVELGQINEAVECYRRALEIKPDIAMTYYNLGNALSKLEQIEEVIVCARKALELNPDFTDAHNTLAFALLLTGQFYEGWKEYWWRIRPLDRINYPARPLFDNKASTRSPVELLPSDLHGMRVALLKDHQGIGDEIFFLRFAKELKMRGAWIGYAGEPRIAQFVRRIKWFDYVSENEQAIEDSHVALLVGDLPLALGMATETDIPPPLLLEALPEKRQEINLRLAPYHKATQPLIGITWRAGGDKRKHMMVREIPVELLGAALRAKQATFVIVQRNPQPGEITAFEDALGQQVLDLSELNNDLEGMLALMEHLDDYIGVDNTNMHLRASVGKTARLLVPHLNDFRCMAKGDRSPWFPGFTIYRRTLYNDWDNAIEQLKYHIA
jgi:tetratricopeptide (TPR) repeat protein